MWLIDVWRHRCSCFAGVSLGRKQDIHVLLNRHKEESCLQYLTCVTQHACTQNTQNLQNTQNKNTLTGLNEQSDRVSCSALISASSSVSPWIAPPRTSRRPNPPGRIPREQMKALPPSARCPFHCFFRSASAPASTSTPAQKARGCCLWRRNMRRHRRCRFL